MKMPKFGVKGKAPKVEAGIDARIEDPSADINASGSIDTPKLDMKVNAEAPTLDASVKTPRKKFKGPACLQGEKPDPYLLKLQGPKIEGEAKPPKVKGDAEIKANLPDAEIDL